MRQINASSATVRRRERETGADPENDLGGGQFRGSGDGSPPAGSRGGAPVRGLGDFDFSQLKASWGSWPPWPPLNPPVERDELVHEDGTEFRSMFRMDMAKFEENNVVCSAGLHGSRDRRAGLPDRTAWSSQTTPGLPGRESQLVCRGL